MDGFERIVNGLNKRPKVDVYITGSNSKFLSQEINTIFRERSDEVNIMVGVAIAVNDDKDKKTQTRKIFFSTDLSLNGEQIYSVYRSRFQIDSSYTTPWSSKEFFQCPGKDRT